MPSIAAFTAGSFMRSATEPLCACSTRPADKIDASPVITANRTAAPPEKSRRHRIAFAIDSRRGMTSGRRLFVVCYTASGAAALVYEVAWTRMLTLQLGHTVAAASTVLAAFMGGLALGAWVIARLP